MVLGVGSRLGYYDVPALIGEGAMDLVHRATDTKLNHQVAFEVFPEALTAHPDRISQLGGEAWSKQPS